jgi:hypothetical protein
MKNFIRFILISIIVVVIVVVYWIVQLVIGLFSIHSETVLLPVKTHQTGEKQYDVTISPHSPRLGLPSDTKPSVKY